MQTLYSIKKLKQLYIHQVQKQQKKKKKKNQRDTE